MLTRTSPFGSLHWISKSLCLFRVRVEMTGSKSEGPPGITGAMSCAERFSNSSACVSNGLIDVHIRYIMGSWQLSASKG